MRIPAVVVILLLNSFSDAATALRRTHSIADCGIHEIEGYLVRAGKDSLALKVNAQSDSEFQVDLGSYDAAKYEMSLGTKVRTRVVISQPCYAHCVGKLIKWESLSPWDHPKTFLAARRVPLEKLACRPSP